VQCTVLAGADRATKAVGLFKTDNTFLVVDCARPVVDHCLFFLVRFPMIILMLPQVAFPHSFKLGNNCCTQGQMLFDPLALEAPASLVYISKETSANSLKYHP